MLLIYDTEIYSLKKKNTIGPPLTQIRSSLDHSTILIAMNEQKIIRRTRLFHMLKPACSSTVCTDLGLSGEMPLEGESRLVKLDRNSVAFTCIDPQLRLPFNILRKVICCKQETADHTGTQKRSQSL